MYVCEETGGWAKRIECSTTVYYTMSKRGCKSGKLQFSSVTACVFGIENRI